MKFMPKAATCKGDKIASTTFRYDFMENTISLKINTIDFNNWAIHYENIFIFEEVLEVDGYPLPYDPDAEDDQDLYIIEHGEARDGIRHFSFIHSEGRAEIHIKARGISTKQE